MHAYRAVFVQNNPAAIERLHGPQVVKSDSAIVFRLDDRLLESLAGRSADVKCPHRQLCPGLAD